jgi:hypothetical protein
MHLKHYTCVKSAHREQKKKLVIIKKIYVAFIKKLLFLANNANKGRHMKTQNGRAVAMGVRLQVGLENCHDSPPTEEMKI